MTAKRITRQSRYLTAGQVSWTETLILLSTLVLLYSDALSGVMRYAFKSVGVPTMSYLPMICVIACVLVVTVMDAFQSRFGFRVAIILLGFLTVGFYGWTIGRAWSGILLGLYTWSPFFLGCHVLRLRLLPKLLPHVYVLLIVSIAGVLINSVVPMPWVGGESFTVGGREVVTAVDWNAMGVDRLPGFSRASFTAANDITLFLLWILCTTKSVPTKLALWAASIYAIILTTAKTPLMIVLVGPVLLLIHSALRTKQQRFHVWRHLFSYAVLIALLAAVIAPPLLNDLDNARDKQLPFADVLPFLRIDSFIDRVLNMWPAAFRLLEVGDYPTIQSVFGRGIGGIGVGQSLNEPTLVNAADNMHVFLYVTFGVFSSVFYLVLIYGHKVSFTERYLPQVAYVATMIGVLGLGTLTSLVEAAIPVMAFGIMIANCVSPGSRGPARESVPQTLRRTLRAVSLPPHGRFTPETS